MERALLSGANFDSRANDQATPLMAPANANQSAIVDLLRSEGANVMARNRPLSWEDQNGLWDHTFLSWRYEGAV
ncbi:hypothetical protein GCM10007874_45440 [Labrys miyagiensis]|uniref:Uncharacterized protein n=2 Tax=Labrys miyagiensis TaxID=346912 RepID=A0ABQ6CMD9_9HYPH|nr:hypothetical protein GCM10007874_45440 [Labrys miyagiensis]